MRGNTPEISTSSFDPLGRRLTIADWALLAAGLLFFAGGIILLNPLKFTVAIVFLILVAIAFFSPKYGLYVLYGAEGAYILVFYTNLMALAPAQIGLDYTIGFVVEGSHLFIVPLVILMFAYLMGFVARHFISGKRYMQGAFEGALIAFLIFTIAWISIAVANENYPLTILTDLHVVFMLAMGIFAGRSLRSLGDFKSLFNFIIIISLLHWIFLTGYFVQQHLYTELLFIMDLIRDIQGSSDLYSPMIPVMLAFISANDNGNRGRIEKLYPFLAFLFFVRTILCLSRGAILQVAVSVIALYFMMPLENRKVYTGLIKRQLVYIAIFCVLIFVASPSLASFGFKTLGSRIADSGKTARESVSLGSLKYRELETQMVMESIAESPIIGYGPGKQTKKRMFTYTSATEEPYVHNGYLWYMLKFGALGLLFLGYVLVRYFLSIKKTISIAPTQMKFLLMGTAASLIGILPIVLTNNVIGAVQGNVFVSFIFGLAIFAERQMMENRLEQNGEEDVDA